jgi:glycerophosphoryl diester phosphodiesterase
LNVELKGPGTAVPTAEFLIRHPHLDVLVSSFDHKLLSVFRQRDPHTRVAPLFNRWRGKPWHTAALLGAWAVNLSHRIVTPERLAAAAHRGLRTFVYTVNDLEEARALIGFGATGVFTDYPDRITPAALAGQALC